MPKIQYYFSSPILSIASYQHEIYVDGSEVAVCLTAADTFWPTFFFVGSISFFFLLPFVILVVLYSVIAKDLMENPGIISHGHRNNVLKYRKQVIFMLGAVVLSFFVCLLPFRALTLWIIIASDETIMALGIEGYYNILYFCRIMLYLNSAMNPILYNLMSSKFRDGFLRLLGIRSIRGKLISGGRKNTFHTTSTNLSSSQNSEHRRRDRSVRDDSRNLSFKKDDSASGDDTNSDNDLIYQKRKLKIDEKFNSIEETDYFIEENNKERKIKFNDKVIENGKNNNSNGNKIINVDVNVNVKINIDDVNVQNNKKQGNNFNNSFKNNCFTKILEEDEKVNGHISIIGNDDDDVIDESIDSVDNKIKLNINHICESKESFV